MKVTTHETLYHEDHSAIWKHKCGKRDSSIVPSLFFSHFIFLSFSFFSFFSFFFFGLSFLLAFLFFCKVWSLIPTCGGIIVFIILSSLGQCSNNEDHHTFMDLQLKARTRYDSIWMPPAMYRDMQWIKSNMYENYEGGLATNTMSTTWSCKEQYDKSNACHMNGTVESCIAIYLGMAMEMP